MHISRISILRNFVVSCFMLAAVAFTSETHAAPICAELFGSSPTSGSNLGPIELIRDLKQTFLPSKLVRSFDQNKYQEAIKEIKEQDLRVETEYRPQTLEESVAYLDVQLESLSISVAQMPPVLRHKVYKTVKSILKSQSRDNASQSQNLADLIFRGNYTKPTSFFNIFTQGLGSGGRELFIQHLHALEVSDIVTAAYDYNPGPKRAGFIARNLNRIPVLPKLYKNHREAILATFWGGVSIATSLQVHSVDGLFLPSFSMLKTNGNKALIENTYLEKGLQETIRILGPEYNTKNKANYTYAILEKAINWYFIITIFTSFSDCDPSTETCAAQ